METAACANCIKMGNYKVVTGLTNEIFLNFYAFLLETYRHYSHQSTVTMYKF